jgi:hypothetical protein
MVIYFLINYVVFFEKQKNYSKRTMLNYITHISPKGRIQGIRVRFSGGTMFDECACHYARAGLVVHFLWVRYRCESKKIVGYK